MKNNKRSPIQVAGIAFLITLLVPVCLIVIATLLPPESLPVGTGDFIEVINSSLCPAALIIGAVAFFWAKRHQ